MGEKNKLVVVFFLVGLILVGIGVLGFKAMRFNSGPKVEILEKGEGEENTEVRDGKWEVGEITVEAAGAVIKPGVYKLKSDSRINDLLTLAGGLSGEADRDWAAKNINLAQKLTDGAKIFIPKRTDLSNLSNLPNLIEKKINLNTASSVELDTLWGVGPATAQKIISGRPYQKIEELLERKIVSNKVWEEIKDKVVVY